MRGVYQRVTDAPVVGLARNVINPRAHRLLICSSDFLWLHLYLLARFHVFEACRCHRREIQFVWMHQMQQQDLKATMQELA